MTTMETAPALVQAAELFAVARHLTVNPHLHRVWVAGRDLQITHNTEDAANLVAWAESLAGPSVEVSDLDGVAFVYVTGEIDGIPVRVWSTVTGLLGWLSMERACYHHRIEPEWLREFAATAGSGDHRG